MAIDIIARGLATSLIGSDGKIDAGKMPVVSGTSELQGFTSIGKLTDPSLVEGKTAEEILLMMLYGIVNPVLTEPSLSIALNDDNGALIIGREQTLKGALIFSRGTIDPAYGTSGYRAGVPTMYTIGDNSFETSSTSYDFEITLMPTEKEVVLSYSVAYSAGEQPMNSVGKPFGAPLEAGYLFSSVTIPAAYELYQPSGEAQEFTWFEDKDEQTSGYLSTFAAETPTEKQSFMVSTGMTVIGIKTFNVLSQQWEWLGGSAAESLTYFDTEIISGESLGEATNYISYTHNQARCGERELRIYVQ